MLNRNYSEMAGLSNIYLEDSWVLSIDASLTHLDITLEVVLLESHPLYRSPKTDEHYCYRRAKLRFIEPSRFTFEKVGAASATDGTGSVDYGNIDIFMEDGPGQFYLEGDWGSLRLSGAPPSLLFLDD